MIKWAEHIYIGDSLKKKKDKIIATIDKGELTFGIYCIAFASNQNNLFDIYNAKELSYSHYKKTVIHILGLAKGKEEAISLVESMLLEIFNETGGFNVVEYFN